ncbi:unnamed protein product [Lactuca saligna]|uniref:DDE Tnp4 domain-containing protein n=1 Tax=Lactuca saligna TaxID=75948 RepID=A0AA36EJH9_LACSI|nr:unnamed protein product [Lactuca saligna]
MLEQRGGLKNSKNMLVDEQVAMFLQLVLDAVCRLHKKFYKKPVPIPDDETDERWRWFKGFLGALDGTYIKVKVLAAKRKPYRTRKGEICTNIVKYSEMLLVDHMVLKYLMEHTTFDMRVIQMVKVF